MPDRVMYNIPDLTKLLGYSKNHIRGLIEAGELRAVRSGRTVRVHVDDLNRWLEEHKTGSRGDAA